MSINIIRQGGGIQIIRDAAGPMGPQDFLFGFFIGGPPSSLELLLRAEITQAMRASADVSAASAETNIAAISQIFTMSMDGVTVGTITFPAGVTTGVVAFTTTVWEPGIFRLLAPVVTDPGLSGISATIGGAKI